MFLSGWDCETGLVFWLMLGTVPIRGVQREPILLKFILFSSGKNVIFVNVSQVESPVITVNFFSFPKGLSHLVAASFTEDQFGVVQTTLPAILNTLLTLQEVKTINCSLPLNKFIRGEGVLLILYFDTNCNVKVVTAINGFSSAVNINKTASSHYVHYETDE